MSFLSYLKEKHLFKIIENAKNSFKYDNNEAKMFELRFNNDHSRRCEALKEIKKSFLTLENCFNYLNRIDSCDNFTNKQWFEFGVYC